MKIQHHRLYEQVITYLQELIKNEKIIVGDRLPTERRLAEDLNVSRGTLRDAFRVLESKKIVETIPGGGRILARSIEEDTSSEEAIFQELKKAEIYDLIEMREILEVGMCRLICNRITNEEINEIEEILVNGKEEKDFNASTYFHLALASASNNQVLESFLKINLKLIKEIRDKNFFNTENKEQAMKEHIELLDAIRSRNIVRCELAVQNHFVNMRKRLNLE